MYLFKVDLRNGCGYESTRNVVSRDVMSAVHLAVYSHNKENHVVDAKMNDHCVVWVERGVDIDGIEP